MRTKKDRPPAGTAMKKTPMNTNKKIERSILRSHFSMAAEERQV